MDLVKSFSLVRPAKPNPIFSWSLDKVLDLLKTWRNDKIDLKSLLQKSFFLLTLAMGGRVSEVAALRKGDDYILFFGDGILTLSTGPDFLAKNESSFKRRDPININSLPSEGELCPVSTLRTYLRRTREYRYGPWFRHSESGKSLSLTDIKILITRVIKLCNPNSIPKTHDIRKLASSLAFFGFMDF